MKAAWIQQQNERVALIESTGLGYRIQRPQELPHPPDFPGFFASTIPYSSLPQDKEGINLPPFFLNLLPEGSRLAALMSRSKIAKDDALGLLLAAEGEPPGDVQLIGTSEAKIAGDEGWITDFAGGNFTWSELNSAILSGGRIDSLSGVQNKVSRGSLTIPLTKSLAPQILKIPTESYPYIAENEFFIMQLARTCGFKVSPTRLVRDRNGAAAFSIQRFDRATRRGKILERFHLEDGCQLLNVNPSDKYDLSLQAIAKRMSELTTSEGKTLISLSALIAFSYIIGNADMHAKNISLMWRRGICDLSPAYDLLTTLPYRDHNQLMALKLFGRANNIRLRDLHQLGDRFEVPRVAITSALRKRLAPIPREIQNFGTVGFDEKTSEYVISEVLRRYESFFASDETT